MLKVFCCFPYLLLTKPENEKFVNASIIVIFNLKAHSEYLLHL